MKSIIDDIINNDDRYSFGSGGENNTNQTEKTEVKSEEKPDDKTTQQTDQNVENTGEQTGSTETDTGEKKEVSKPSEEDLAKKFMSDFNERLGTQYSDFNDFKSDYEQINTLRESEKALKDKLSQQSNPFGEDKEMSEMYGFRKETGRSLDDYRLLKNLDIENAKPVDLMIAKKMLDNPSFRGKEAQVRRMVEREFGINDEDLGEEEIEINEMRLTDKSNPVRKELMDLKGKIQPYEFESFEDQKIDPEVWKQQEQQWNGMIPQITSQLDTFKLFDNPDDEKNGKDAVLNIKLPQETINEYNKNLAQYVSETKLEPTKENQQHLYALMVQDYVLKNYHTIASEYAAEKLKANNAMWSERTGVDISKLGNTVVPGEKTSDVDKFNKDEQDKILKKLGIRKG